MYNEYFAALRRQEVAVSIRRVAIFVGFLIVAGATVNAQVQNPPRVQKAPDQAATVNEAPDAGRIPTDSKAQPVDPHTYSIGPEDILKITVWRDNDLSGVVAVRPDGKITRPLIGDVQAAGLTPERLTAQLREAYTQVRNPEITVEVLQINSKKYSITGGVNRPGTYPLVVATKVFDALTLSGGFQEFANKKNVEILRADGTKLKFDWTHYTKHPGDAQSKRENVDLLPGDTIIVKD